MNDIYLYLALSGVLTILMWVPYISARAIVWGIPSFLNNYPKDFPAKEPEMPLWAERSKRAHLNMVETMPAFIAVVIAATQLAPQTSTPDIIMWCKVFFYARIVHLTTYTFGIPYLRTPPYLVSWAAILIIASHCF